MPTEDDLTGGKRPYRRKTTLPAEDDLTSGRRACRWTTTLPAEDDLTGGRKTALPAENDLTGGRLPYLWKTILTQKTTLQQEDDRRGEFDIDFFSRFPLIVLCYPSSVIIKHLPGN